MLKGALLFKKGVMVISVPIFWKIKLCVRVRWLKDLPVICQ